MEQPMSPSAPVAAEVATQIAQVRLRLAEARRICAFTGAGMSAESGIPTFRDAMTGLWAQFDPQALASEAGFRADPRRVWSWYAERRTAMRAVAPNAGHGALGDFARRYPGRLRVVTQNVDDLHQRAGNTDAIQLHGDILADRWLAPCPLGKACAVGRATGGEPPTCAECGNPLRPGVVWFGEMLPEQALRDAEAQARSCEVMLVVGTSGAVWPAAGLAGTARRAGAWVVVVNPQPTEIDDEAHLCLRGTAATLLPALLDGL
jgi:NAD-dependent deacetylase